MWPWRVKMSNQNLFRLLLLLMLMLRNGLRIVCFRFGRFGGWSLVIKLIFCSDLEHKVWSRFWSWSSDEILKLKFLKRNMGHLIKSFDDRNRLHKEENHVRKCDTISKYKRPKPLVSILMLMLGWGYEVNLRQHCRLSICENWLSWTYTQYQNKRSQ